LHDQRPFQLLQIYASSGQGHIFIEPCDGRSRDWKVFRHQFHPASQQLGGTAREVYIHL
jgi:hypothetical protein